MWFEVTAKIRVRVRIHGRMKIFHHKGEGKRKRNKKGYIKRIKRGTIKSKRGTYSA